MRDFIWGVVLIWLANYFCGPIGLVVAIILFAAAVFKNKSS